MCFDLDSAPPIPVLRGAAVSHDDLVLEGRDGNRFAAFVATPDEPTGVGVAILPDVRGLYRFYEELALRFAERGYTVSFNDPYKGGFITAHHGRPADNIHAIQIELRRDLYMNEEAYTITDGGFAKLRETIDALLASLKTFRP